MVLDEILKNPLKIFTRGNKFE